MKNNSQESADDMPDVQILADDLPGDTAAAQPAVQDAASAGPINLLDEMVKPTDADPFGRTTGYSIGDKARALIEKLIGRHKGDFLELQAEARELEEIRLKFACYAQALDQSKVSLDAIRIEVGNFLSVDVGQTLFKNHWNMGRSFMEICNPAQNPQLFTAFLLKTYGAEVLKKAELEHGALDEAFRNFKQKHRSRLKQLALI